VALGQAGQSDGLYVHVTALEVNIRF
jgi:hypothetical protein